MIGIVFVIFGWSFLCFSLGRNYEAYLWDDMVKGWNKKP